MTTMLDERRDFTSSRQLAAPSLLDLTFGGDLQSPPTATATATATVTTLDLLRRFVSGSTTIFIGSGFGLELGRSSVLPVPASPRRTAAGLLPEPGSKEHRFLMGMTTASRIRTSSRYGKR